MTVTITTGGSLLVNGLQTATLSMSAGTSSLTYTLSHPNDGTRNEWLNITASGACVDAGHFSTQTTQSILEPIYPRMCTPSTPLSYFMHVQLCVYICLKCY
jgi:hypothetical protein